MYALLFQQFLRAKTTQLGLVLLMTLGVISLMIGKQFLSYQQEAAAQVAAQQRVHIERNVAHHQEDLPLLLYYLKFSLINETAPLAGLSIGQRDLHPSIQRVKMLTLEGQKYDTDLVNPAKLLYGNLDLSFVVVYLFPLLVIAFMFNLLSEEEESGTWKMVSAMAKSKTRFLMGKALVRMAALLIMMLVLFGVGAAALGIPLNASFLLMICSAILYVVFWFALCFFIVCLRQRSSANALSLLLIWLVLVVLVPAVVNNYVTNKFPIPEAFSTMIKQRDGYHTKWDTNKKATLEQFYKEYPQFEKNGFPPEEGFNWPWYYAMQHLGDVEAREESDAMHQKIKQREATSRSIAKLVPSMHTQLAFNTLAQTGLLQHMDFLKQTTTFHEDIRLFFYPLVFSGAEVDSVDWTQFTPEYFTPSTTIDAPSALGPLVLSVLVLMSASALALRKIT